MIHTPSKSQLLFWTGLATMLSGLQFVLPIFVLKLLGIAINDAAGMLYVRHWGLMALCLGALLIYASSRVVARHAIVLAVAVEKLGFVALVAMAWNEPGVEGLRGAAVFDATCVLLYIRILWPVKHGESRNLLSNIF